MVTIPAWVRGPKWTNIAFIVRPWATLRMAVLHFQLKRVPASYAIAVITLLVIALRLQTLIRQPPNAVDLSLSTVVMEHLSLVFLAQLKHYRPLLHQLSFVPVLHEIPATFEELISAPAPKHLTAVPMPSEDSSVDLVFVPTPVPCTPSDHFQSTAA
ncbi:hypothetical protein G6F70_006042 [Rhizopus microsporus]|nr:hypothetical protein G6F71_005918 [Rhizopus microsporus]KAG1198147.1 hypothetical protein G6F70_006042 [Rhizopus microsporus]KAG1209898.1 hypothetical protein G6F69_005952 [Rhizopus microsporus]KAG1231512.1 hypothetical protein G6F67_005696 [Rhizopus microsporus]KAG1263853.1 hypothetical protein G6F68_004816 [Rhizopus microsporus]